MFYHSTLETIHLDYKGSKVVASPFKIPNEQNPETKKIIEQTNYTNECLNIIGKQLDKIELQLDKTSTSSPPSKQLDTPLINFPEKTIKPLLSTSQNLERIEQLIANIELNQQTLKLKNESISTLTKIDESSTDEEINQIENQFTDLNLKKLYTPTNQIVPSKNWYTGPSPVDLKFST